MQLWGFNLGWRALSPILGIFATPKGIPAAISTAYYVCCFANTADVGFLHHGVRNVYKRLGVPGLRIHECKRGGDG